MKRYIIWHDNDFDLAIWLRDNSVLHDQDVEYRSIPKTNSCAQIIESFSDPVTVTVLPFIRLETPDIILQEIDTSTNVNKVVCVAELMTHTPQWQHPAQRFSRLYNSSKLGVPSALILPHKKTKWERGQRESYKDVSYTCSPSVYELFVETTRKHKTPTLIFSWPDHDGYLKYHPLHPTSPFISDDINNWFDFFNQCVLKSGNLSSNDVSGILRNMESRAVEVDIHQFATIDSIRNTEDVITSLKLNPELLTEDFKHNQESLIFVPSGLVCASSEMRTDPYAGMLCAFDILFCRDNNGNKIRNLVFVAKDVYKKRINFKMMRHNISECPFEHNKIVSQEHLNECPYTQPKYRRIYGEIADIIKFEDCVVHDNRIIQ